MNNNNHITSLAVIAIVAALALLGVVAVTVVTITLQQQAEAAKPRFPPCLGTPGANASLGRCVIAYP